MNENENKESEMDYSQKNPNSIRSSKSKKEKLTKFLSEYDIKPDDLIEVALELIKEEEIEQKKEEAKAKQEESKETSSGRYKDWKTLESRVAYAEVTFPHELEDYPDIDLRKAAMVKELDMLNMSGLLDREDVKELKTMRQEVDTQRSVMESYFERNFNETKSHDSRR